MTNHLKNTFHLSNKTPSLRLEMMLEDCKSFAEFEQKVPDEFLADDNRAGVYLDTLILKYGKKNATLSEEAGLARSYVGHIINGKRDVIIWFGIMKQKSIIEIDIDLHDRGYKTFFKRD